VTAKGEDRNVPLIQWSLVNTFLVYLLMTVVGVFWAFVVEDPTKLSDSSALCLFWSWYNIVILAIACARMHRATKFSVREAPKVERARRAAHRQLVFDSPVLDLSLTGVRLAGVAPATTGTGVMVVINDVRVVGEIARIGRDEFAVQFERDDAARSSIIRHFYSDRYSAHIGHAAVTRCCRHLQSPGPPTGAQSCHPAE